MAYRVVDTLTLVVSVALAHVRATLGTDDDRIDTLASCIFVHEDGGWQPAVFHNTQVSILLIDITF